jgi:hypothetical protein
MLQSEYPGGRASVSTTLIIHFLFISYLTYFHFSLSTCQCKRELLGDFEGPLACLKVQSPMQPFGSPLHLTPLNYWIARLLKVLVLISSCFFTQAVVNITRLHSARMKESIISSRKSSSPSARRTSSTRISR